MTLRDLQEEQLFILVRAAAETQFGQKYRFTNLQRYEDFRDTVPISFYNDIAPGIEQLKNGVPNLFWPENVRKFAISSGTTSTGNHLPLTPERLQSDRRFMRKVTKSYLLQRPNIFRLWGKHISLPGTHKQDQEVTIGEISAHSARNIPWWLTYFQLIDPNKLVTLSFREKVDTIIEKAIDSDIRVVTAAPSWMLTIFQKVLKQTGSDNIGEVWPKLSLLVCGGVKLSSYKPHLRQLIEKPGVDFIETYGASEGYFSYTDDLQRDDMKLVIDNGIFYEFIPNPLPDQNSLAIQDSLPLWEVETGTPYAMIVSTNAGLWRYALNDIVQFTRTDPPRIKVMGRVSEMLDDYGEALYAYEAEQALQEAAAEFNITVGTFTIAATLEDEHSVPRHQWFIHLPDPIHRDTLDRLAQHIDCSLREKNRHYAIRRESEALGDPTLHTISQQQINAWLKKNGKEKAQGKLPSILDDNNDIRFFR